MIKRYKLYFITFFSFISILIVISSKPVKNGISSDLKSSFIKHLTIFNEEIIYLKKLVDNQSSNAELLDQFKILRKAYKRIELFIGYYFSSSEKKINGPNLLGLYGEESAGEVLNPQGMQIIEELLFAESNPDNYKQVSRQLYILSKRMQSLLNETKKINLQDRHIFEACREEILRIETLGISGFDSPILSYAVPEAYAALESVYQTLIPYLKKVKERDKKLYKSSHQLFKTTLDYLNENNDFETFNRTYFIRELSDPLYKQVYLIHKVLNIETFDQISDQNRKVNYHATSLFDQDFLNPLAFNKLLTEEKNSASVILGKMLFFDPILSSDNGRSCASCHNPKLAFTDGVAKSKGFNQSGVLRRNSPTLINAVFQNSYFLDGRSEQLEQQVAHVVNSHEEFNTNYVEILNKLKNSDEYMHLFKKAYPGVSEDYLINVNTFTKSIANYIRSLVAFNSPFDQYMRKELASIDYSIQNGFSLFMGKAGCGTCHFPPVFNGTIPPNYHDTDTEVLGVPSLDDSTKLDTDLGKFEVFHHEFLKGSFKTPTIRNIALTAPFMHNGIYHTLEEVVRFYNDGGGTGRGIDVNNQTLPSDALNLTNVEVNHLVAFMESLTDTSGLTSMPTYLPTINDSILNQRDLNLIY